MPFQSSHWKAYGCAGVGKRTFRWMRVTSRQIKNGMVLSTPREIDFQDKVCL